MVAAPMQPARRSTGTGIQSRSTIAPVTFVRFISTAPTNQFLGGGAHL